MTSKNLLLVAVVLCSGCVGGGQSIKKNSLPEWVVNPPQKAGQLYGVGSAEVYRSETDALGRAKEAALADLIQQLEVSISASSSNTLTEQSGSNQESQFKREVQQKINTRVPEMRFNYVSMTDSYSDENAKQIYALMALDVTKEVRAIRRRVSELDDELTALSEQRKSTMPVVERLGLHGKALVLFGERDNFEKRLRRLKSNTSVLSFDVELNEYRSQIEADIASITVSIQSAKDNESKISQSVAEQLTRQGIRIVKSGADLVVTYSIDIELVKRDDVFFALGSGDISIADDNGVVVDVMRVNTKTSSSGKALAERRAIEKLSKRFSNILVEVLFGT